MMESVKPKIPDSAEGGAYDAFTQIYETYYPRCFGFFRSRLLNPSLAADLTQEVFVRAYDAIGRFDPSRPADSWLMGISRNVLREFVRRERRRREVSWAELCIELSEAVGEEDPFDDMMPHLEGCIARLAPKTESALRSHYFEGKKLAIVAEELRQSVSAVKMALLRGRRAIKACILSKIREAKR